MDPMKQPVQAMPTSAPAPAGPPGQESRRSGLSIFKMIVAAVLAIVMLIFNIILLAGVGASESKCKDQRDINGFKEFSSSDCRVQYSLAWWVVFFELICVVLAIIAAVAPTVRREIGTGLQAWLAVNTALLAYVASTLNNGIQNNTRNDDLKSANQAALAGAVVLSIANLLYIMMCSSSLAPEINRPSRLSSQMASPPAPPVYMQEVPAPQHAAYNMQPVGQSQEMAQGGVMNYNSGMPQQGYGAPQQGYGATQPAYNMPHH